LHLLCECALDNRKNGLFVKWDNTQYHRIVDDFWFLGDQLVADFTRNPNTKSKYLSDKSMLIFESLRHLFVVEDVESIVKFIPEYTK
jgi:hypothetical protein